MIKILNQNLLRLGIIKNSITSNRLEEINGENILDFNAIFDTKMSELVNENSVYELNNDYFDTAVLKKIVNEDNTYTIEVEGEHVSYRLNNPIYNLEFFTEIGSPSYILSRILEGTDFTVGIVEFSQTETYSAQESKSRRQILMEFVETLKGEVKFNKFEVNILKRRGSDTARPAIKDRNVKVISKSINKRNPDNPNVPLVMYSCTPIYLPGDSYTLGDDILLLQKELGIQEKLRVVSISYDIYDITNITLKFANYTNGLESSLYKISTSTVGKDKLYNGCRIGPIYGFEAIRNDKMARAYFRSDGIKFQSGDGSGDNWEDLLYFEYDSIENKSRLVFGGLLHGGSISLGEDIDNPTFFADHLGNVKSKSLEVSEHILIQSKNSEVLLNEWGMNPDFIKRFPNMVFNSGFEQHEEYAEATVRYPGLPLYWEGDGRCDTWASFEGNVSLELFPTQYIEQGWVDSSAHAGADPNWWHNMQTRVSFRQKNGSVRVWVKLVSNNSNLLLIDNSVEPAVTGEFLDYPFVINWEDGLRTFFFQPVLGGGKVKICFQAIGAAVNIDAVQMEPDFNGKWASFYTPGKRSVGKSDTQVNQLSTTRYSSDHTLNSNDAQAVMVILNSANPLTLTVPNNATTRIPIGTQILIKQLGDGQVTIIPEVNVILYSADDAFNLRTKFSVASLAKIETNIWSVIGDVIV